MARKPGTTLSRTIDTDTTPEESTVTETTPNTDPTDADLEAQEQVDLELEAHLEEHAADEAAVDADGEISVEDIEALLNPVHQAPTTKAGHRLAVAEAVTTLARVQAEQEKARAAGQENRDAQALLRAKLSELRHDGAALREREADYRDAVAQARETVKAARTALQSFSKED